MLDLLARALGGDRSETTADMPLPDPRMKGIAAGTRIATHMGWRPVEGICVGDWVLTFDHGYQMVTAVTRGSFFSAAGRHPDSALPVRVPAGVLGNTAPMLLLADQAVMIECDVVEELFSDPFVLIPARLLAGWRGMARVPQERPVEVVTLHFEADEVVHGEGGALILCPADIPGVPGMDHVTGQAPAPRYQLLDPVRAEVLMEMLICEERRRMGAPAPGCEVFAGA